MMDKEFETMMKFEKTSVKDPAPVQSDTFPFATPLDPAKFQMIAEYYLASLYRYFAVHTDGNLDHSEKMTLQALSIVYSKHFTPANGTFTALLFGIAWDVLNAQGNQRDVKARDRKSDSTWAAQTQKSMPNRSRLSWMLKSVRAVPFYPREALLLRFFARVPVKDIAFLMDKSEAQIKILVHEGVAAFALRRTRLGMVPPSKKQLTHLARAYDLYLDDLVAGLPSKQTVDKPLVQSTRQLKALHDAFTMKAEVKARVLLQTERLTRSNNPSATRL
jgi:DNA-directed RNA polymerase specialized sigma24 family protein